MTPLKQIRIAILIVRVGLVISGVTAFPLLHELNLLCDLLGKDGLGIAGDSDLMIAFITGAVMVSIVDHWVGNLDRSNLRWLYVVMGVLAMSGSAMYRHVLNERVKIELGEPAVPE